MMMMIKAGVKTMSYIILEARQSGLGVKRAGQLVVEWYADETRHENAGGTESDGTFL